MPRVDPNAFLHRFGQLALVNALGEIPALGPVLQAAVQAYQEALPPPTLPEQAQRELRALAADYGQMLRAEGAGKPQETFEGALGAALDALNRYGLDGGQLAQVDFDPDRAARLTLERAAAALDDLDEPGRALARRLVRDYYRVLLTHREAIQALSVPAFAELLQRSAALERRLEELLSAPQRRAWARTRWPARGRIPALPKGELRPFLLRPEFRLVPYTGASFHAARDELVDWALGLAGKKPPLGLRLYTGPGGAGKTRLLLEAGERLREQRWRVAFLAPGPLDGEDGGDGLASCYLAAPGPTLLILDYAATRQREAQALGEAMARAGRLQPFALLLLERQTPEWWEGFVRPATDPGQSGRVAFMRSAPGVEPQAHRLPSLKEGERGELYAAALDALLAHAPNGQAPAPTPAALPARPLFVLLRAYLHAAGEAVADPRSEEDILEHVWRRERELWWRTLGPELERAGFGGGRARRCFGDGIADLLALAALGRSFADEDELADFLEAHERALPRPLDAHDRPLGARWLARSLPRLFPSQPGAGLLPPPPLDVLADALLEERLPANPALLELALPTPAEMGADAGAAAGRVVGELSVLTRLWRHPRRLEPGQIEGWIEELAEGLGGAGAPPSGGRWSGRCRGRACRCAASAPPSSGPSWRRCRRRPSAPG